MDGITDCAYRIVCKEIFEIHGHPDDELMLWTEFMSADGYHHNPPGVIKHILKTDYEPELIAQIFGGNPETLKQCAVDIQKRYPSYAGIELNMGCPSPKIMKCEAGSGMLRDKEKTLGILQDIAQELSLPFSLKTRTGLTNADVNDQYEFLLQASQYVWLIAVHGRTYGQSHAGDVNRDFLYRLKKDLPEKVIIGNGGIRTYEQAVETCQNLDGIMIAQSAIGNPWVLTPHTPTAHERLTTIQRHMKLSMATEHRFNHHVDEMAEKGTLPLLQDLELIIEKIDNNQIETDGDNRRTPREMRKFLFNYISGLPDSKSLKKVLIKTRTYTDVMKMIDEYFSSLSEE